MAPQAKKVSRNPDLIRGIGKYCRSKMYHKRGLWAIKAKNDGSFPRHDAKPEAPKANEKPPKFYPADDVKKPLVNKRKHKPTKLRASITPGTVLIILAGRFKGKIVIFLKQLSSGLLLVSESRSDCLTDMDVVDEERSKAGPSSIQLSNTMTKLGGTGARHVKGALPDGFFDKKR